MEEQKEEREGSEEEEKGKERREGRAWKTRFRYSGQRMEGRGRGTEVSTTVSGGGGARDSSSIQLHFPYFIPPLLLPSSYPLLSFPLPCLPSTFPLPSPFLPPTLPLFLLCPPTSLTRPPLRWPPSCQGVAVGDEGWGWGGGGGGGVDLRWHSASDNI